ncbi:hypothetical protein Tco_1070982 [Tanacetum coccineum]|uniref:Uncharacterized protein n=1 Tax=Tanacetum coccineum TaxID=301880 RepID=A0ABQ5HPS1_9ASTR
MRSVVSVITFSLSLPQQVYYFRVTQGPSPPSFSQLSPYLLSTIPSVTLCQVVDMCKLIYGISVVEVVVDPQTIQVHVPFRLLPPGSLFRPFHNLDIFPGNSSESGHP